VKKVYLAGPINGCNDQEVFGWRKDASEALAGFEVIDPSRRDFRGKESASACDIVELDKKDIDSCDILLAYAVTPSVGTSMEVLYAYAHPLKKTVVAVLSRNASPWLIYHSDYQVGTVSEAVHLIKDLERA